MTLSLDSLRIAGLTSINDLTFDLSTPVTVLIGSNGAGKSNLVSAIDLLGRITDGRLQAYVAQRGGFGQLLHRSTEPSRSVNQVYLEAWGRDGFSGEIGYAATVGAARGDEAAVYESLGLRNDSNAVVQWASLGNSREGRLGVVAEDRELAESEWAGRVLPLLTGCRVFHFHDTTSDSPVKQRADEANNLFLAPDARNIAPLLARLHREVPVTYQRIVRTVRAVAPFFDDFVLEPEFGRLRLRWHEKDLEGVFSADELSDGTLRFICLATLLLQPDRPSTVVLDEPELGLHPFAIDQLAALVRVAVAAGSKVVLATQSVTLLSHFSATEIAVVERTIHGSTVSRLDVDALRDWLDDYSLGELWEKNVLGGRPRPDASVRPGKAAGQL